MYLLKHEDYNAKTDLLKDLEVLNDLNKDFDSLNEIHKYYILKRQAELLEKIVQNPYLQIVSDIAFILNDIQNNPAIQEALKIKENFITE